MSILFQVKMAKGLDGEMTDTDFEIDWTRKLIIIHNSDKYATYRLNMYVNLAYLNNRIIELGYDDKTDQQTLDGKSINGYL